MLFSKKHITDKKNLLNLKPIYAALFLICCCAKNDQNYNQNFSNKYGAEIERIKAERKSDLDSSLESGDTKNKTAHNFEQPQQVSVSEDSAYYAYADIAKLGDNPQQNFMPNGEVYQQTKQHNPSNQLPEDMFVVSYNTEPHPQYSYKKYEFNNIEIPNQDAYGVKTQLLQKPYMIAGNDNLQRSVDHLQKRINDENIELSKTIIAEKKQIRRQQKMAKTFGQDDLENSKKLTEKIETTSNNKKDETTKPKVASNITILDPVTLKPINTKDTSTDKKN